MMIGRCWEPDILFPVLVSAMQRISRTVAFCVVFLLIAIAPIVSADELVFENDDTLSGSVRGLSRDTVIFESEVVGKIEIDLSRVRSLTVTDLETVREVRLQNDDTLSGRYAPYPPVTKLNCTLPTGRS